jgi:hypothetical protein
MNENIKPGAEMLLLSQNPELVRMFLRVLPVKG